MMRLTCPSAVPSQDDAGAADPTGDAACAMGSPVSHLPVAQPSPISENTAPIMRIGNLLEGKTCTTRLPLSSSRLPVLHVVGAKAPMVRVGEAEVGQCVGLGILQQLGRFGANAGDPPAGQVVELAHGGGGTFVEDGVQDREHGNRSPGCPRRKRPRPARP